MNKRRRAYKKYDWKAHQWAVIKAEVTAILSAEMTKVLDNAILYGSEKHLDPVMPVRIAVPDYLLKAVPDSITSK